MNWLLVKNSLLVGGATTLLSVSLGLVAALCLAGLPRFWRALGLGAAILALALPAFLVTNSWLHFLGPTGVWRSWLHLDIVSFTGAIWILSLLLWPIPLLAVLSAWRRLEPAQLESDTAVTGRHLFRGLLLPLARPALAQSAVLTFVLALNNFAVPSILQVKTFPSEVWIRFSTNFDALGALKLSWPMILGPLVLLLRLTRRALPWPHIQATVPPALFRRQLGPALFFLCSAVTALLLAFSVALPLLQILFVRRTWTELPGALAAGQSAIWNSFWLAAASATAAVALSLSPVLLLGNRRPVSCLFNRFNSFNFFNAFRVSLWLPFLIPGVLLGIALIKVFNRDRAMLFYQSAGIVILAFLIRYLAVSWNTVAHAAQTVDPDLLEVARLEGAGRWPTLRHAVWPQIAPSLAAVWYVIFLLCLWDVESIMLIIPPSLSETLALRIFNFLHYGHNAQVNALCLTLLAVALVPLVLWQVTRGLRAVCASLTHKSSGTGSPNPKSKIQNRIFNFQLLISNCRTPARGPLKLAIGNWKLEIAALRISDFTLAVAATCLLLLVPGCVPKRSSDQLLHSQFFSEIKIIGKRGVGVGELNKPRSLAVDAFDNLYVVDMTGRVQKFSPNGVYLLSWQMPQTDLGKPKGMGRDRQGNILVVEPHYSRVNDFSPQGQLLWQLADRGTNDGQLSVPRAVGIDSSNELFVTEYLQAERVQKFSLNRTMANGTAPKWVSSFGRPGTGPGEFNRAEGLGVDAHNRVYVADSCNHRIQVFSSDGKFLRAYGKPGKGKGELSYPYDVCVDVAGYQYVCEFGNSRIQIFDDHDRSVEIIGGPGAEPGQFSNPWSVALDSAGNLYVADSQNHRVQKLIRKR